MYQYLVGTSQKHWNALNTWGPSKELNQPKKRWQKCLISGPLGDPTDPVLFMFKTKTEGKQLNALPTWKTSIKAYNIPNCGKK